MTRADALDVVRLAGPIVLGSVSHTVVTLMDGYLVAAMEGEAGDLALAALGPASILVSSVFLIFSGIATAVQVLVARRVGEGRPHEVGGVLATGLRWAAVLAAICLVTGLVLPRWLIPHFTDHPGVQAMAIRYLEWRWAGGMGLLLLTFVFKGACWGLSLTRLDLTVSASASALNVALAWALIEGRGAFPALGVEGAGLASAVSNLFALAAFALAFSRSSMRRRFGHWPLADSDRETGRALRRLAVPRSIQSLAFASSAIPFFALVGRLAGPEALSATTLIWRIFGLHVMVSVGIGTAVATLVSRELGRGDADAAAAYGRAALAVGVGVLGTTSGVALLFASNILRAFHLEEPTIAAALPALRLVLVLQALEAVGVILARALVGAGDAVFVMTSEIAIAWCVCIPLTFLGIQWLAPEAPLLGAWLGWAGYILAWMSTMTLRWRAGSWRHARI